MTYACREHEEAMKKHKNAKLHLAIIPRKDCIEEIFWRFPHVGQQIFEQLDNQSLAKCQSVSPLWNKSLNEDKTIFIRCIQEILSMPKSRGKYFL